MKGKKQTVQLMIEKSWNGEMADISDSVTVTFHITATKLEVQIDAPFHKDPAPSTPAGECEGLWRYEVVELFLLGTAGHYLEIELGPHGHHLIYHLSGIRQVARTLSPTRCKTHTSESRWQGDLTLNLDKSLLPFRHVNAYAIHGQGAERRYFAAFPVPGETPDFHQPGSFACIDQLSKA